MPPLENGSFRTADVSDEVERGASDLLGYANVLPGPGASFGAEESEDVGLKGDWQDVPYEDLRTHPGAWVHAFTRSFPAELGTGSVPRVPSMFGVRQSCQPI